MGWLDRLRRGGGARADERPAKVAVIGLDGVGLPLVQDLIARGITPNLGRLAAAGTMAPMRSSIPTISSVSWTGFMTGKNPGKHGVYGFTDVKPGHAQHVLPELRQRARRHALGHRGPRRQALHRPEHSQHLSGAGAERPPGVRLRRRQPRARRVARGAAAAAARGRLPDRRRLRERRPAAGRVLHRSRGDARGAPPRLSPAAAGGGVGPLHRRHHRVRPAAPLLLEPVRRSRRARITSASSTSTAGSTTCSASWSRPCRRTSRSSSWPTTATR